MSFDREAIDAIEKIAQARFMEPAALLAIAEVESAGRTHWVVRGKEMPAMRFEGHIFHKLLSGRERRAAVRQGLASPRSGRVKMPRSYAGRYDLLARAMKIDEDAALQSASWGLGQVMGFNWKSLGFDNVQDLVAMAHQGAAGQVELMVRFIERNNLTKFVKAKNWAAFAKRYNGPGYRRNRYDTKMAAAYKRWKKRPAGGTDTKGDDDVVLARVDFLKGIQRDLNRLGYKAGKVDGDMGPRTRSAVRDFQRDSGLVVDGKPGPMTREELDDEIKKLDSKQGTKAINTGVTAAVATTVGDKIMEQVPLIQELGIESVWIDYGVAALTLGAVGFILYGTYKKMRSGDGE